MQNTGNNYELLISRLDQFIRKYYFNQILKGALYSIGLIIGLYLIVSASEYYFYFSTIVRKLLFFGFLFTSVFVIGKWIVIPVFHLFKIGKRISHEQASLVIGKHFSNVEDRLLNVLQLKKQSENVRDRALIEASIDQKITAIKPVPFTNAIQYSSNKKYLKYALPPALFLILILFGRPSILEESNKRLILNNTAFERKSPFEITVLNEDNLSVLQYNDFTLKVKVDGEYLPENVVLQTDHYSYQLNRDGKNEYSFQFKKVKDPVSFKILANDYPSKKYNLNVLPKPAIIGFKTSLQYPAYTKLQNETKNNIGDLIIPAGTKINWRLNAANTNQIDFLFPDTLIAALRNSDEDFNFTIIQKKSADYKIFVSNKNIRHGDSILYSIHVIPDMYPTIQVEQFIDSSLNEFVYFTGNVGDDYGVTKIDFEYKIISPDAQNQGVLKSQAIKYFKETKDNQFNYTLNIKELDLKPGDAVHYYFKVWDNDGVNGSKFSKSSLFTYEMPTLEELEEITSKQNDQLKTGLEKNIDKAQKLKDQIREMRDKLLNKKDLDWDDKKAMENLINKQNEMMEKVKSMQKDFKNNVEKQSEYKEEDKRILEKQQKLEDLFDEIVNDEMRELMEKIDKLMDELDKEKAIENLEKFDLTNEQLEKELDRMLELFKQLEFEQKLQETIDELNELAEKQEDLSKKSEENKDGEENKELIEKQEEVNKEFEDIKDKLSELEKMNNDLENKNPLEDTDKQEDDIQKDLNQSKQSLEKQENQKAAKKQKDAGKKMKEMSDQLSSTMSAMQSEQMEMDMEAIRQLLDNLINLSFDQEENLNDIIKTNVNSPMYKELIKEQYDIKKDIKMVEDSLLALSKRVYQISSFVNKEVTEVKHNMEKSIQYLEDRNKSKASAKQQYVMTGLNNLALMLDEIMQAMQQEMASKMSGTQMCQKPKGGKSMKDIKNMQEKLNGEMKGLKEKMEGKGKGKGSMSKELAQLAAQQSAIRKALKELNEKYNKDGKKKLGDLDQLADEMEQTEEDLVNKRLTRELMERQEEILIRLLEAENAEKEREKSPERESKTADDVSKKLPPSVEEYLKQKEADIDLYKTVPPNLNPFYKNLVEKYFRSFNLNN
jgi:flagellar biosynthesis GTPase FlhF